MESSLRRTRLFVFMLFVSTMRQAMSRIEIISSRNLERFFRAENTRMTQCNACYKEISMSGLALGVVGVLNVWSEDL